MLCLPWLLQVAARRSVQTTNAATPASKATPLLALRLRRSCETKRIESSDVVSATMLLMEAALALPHAHPGFLKIHSDVRLDPKDEFTPRPIKMLLAQCGLCLFRCCCSSSSSSSSRVWPSERAGETAGETAIGLPAVGGPTTSLLRWRCVWGP
jgi:hypothetical protein